MLIQHCPDKQGKILYIAENTGIAADPAKAPCLAIMYFSHNHPAVCFHLRGSTAQSKLRAVSAVMHPERIKDLLFCQHIQRTSIDLFQNHAKQNKAKVRIHQIFPGFINKRQLTDKGIHFLFAMALPVCLVISRKSGCMRQKMPDGHLFMRKIRKISAHWIPKG